MFYYKYKPEITNVYNPEVDLVVTAVIHIYADENKTDFLMQMPFAGFPFRDVPNKTADGLKQYLEQKIEEVMQQWTERFEEIKIAKQLGLYIPIEPQIQFPEDQPQE